MQLINVLSATYTAIDGRLDLSIEADLGNGTETLPYTYAPGETHGLGPQVATWLAANPGLEPAPYVPPPVVILPRSKRQINAALILSGLTTEPETWMDGILANIPDPVTRALALNDRRNAPYYERSNPLFNDPALLALAGLTVEQVDAMWAAAGGYPE